MQIVFTKSKWEMWDDPLPDFLGRAKKDGFDAVEPYSQRPLADAWETNVRFAQWLKTQLETGQGK